MNSLAGTGEITNLLRRINAGDAAAESLLIEQVYAELKKLAARFMRSERSGHTLQPTALVHEAFVRLAGSEKIEFVDRGHFFAVAAQIMRRLLVDHGRKHKSAKRGGGKLVSLESQLFLSCQPPVMMDQLDKALDRLALAEPRQAKIVEMRFFGGMSEQEIAAHLNISTRTVKRDWVLARAALHSQLVDGAQKRPS